MRIDHYRAVLARGERVQVLDDLLVDPPDPVAFEVGPCEDLTAAQAVEMHRALTAWLQVHKRLHPRWHAEYRERDPGGPSPGSPIWRRLRERKEGA